MSRLGNAIISIFRKGEKRISSQEFEQAVNLVLLSDTVSDATKKPLITPEGSKPRPPLTVKSETDIFAPGCTYTRPSTNIIVIDHTVKGPQKIS